LSSNFDYRDQLVETLKEWCRVLAPAGTLCVSVPDLDSVARLFLDRSLLSVQDRFLVIAHDLCADTSTSTNYHLVGLNERVPNELLQAGGFTSIRRVPSFGLFQDTSCLELKNIPISFKHDRHQKRDCTGGGRRSNQASGC